MTNKPKPGGLRNPPGGRPPKGNVELKCYVKKETREKIKEMSKSQEMTLGEVVDFLVSVAANVAAPAEDSDTPHHRA